MTPWARASLRDLATGRADILVIGGGITGAGIAREAALRGLAVTLVEAGDFASGTSSRSSRLIHGGLRYLESGALHLVFESLRERAVLLRIAPHLVRPLPFILPTYRGDRIPRWKAAAGLVLYDLLAGRGNVPRHRTLGKRALLELEPLLRERELVGGAQYFDAQCDDARLTLAVVRAAARAGARVANYTRAVDLARNAAGRIVGARIRDELSGAEALTQARLVLNATGPWSDWIRRLEDPAAEAILRPTKGSHVQVLRERIGNRHAILFTSPIDGRVMFVLPWDRWSYIGTTDVDTHAGPDVVEPDESELVYLIRSANALFPGARLALDDVVARWAGLRPLLAGPAGQPPSRVSREHRVLRGAGGMLTVAGGKLTTFRSMAADAVDQAARDLGVRAPDAGKRSATEPLPGGESASLDGFRAPGRELGLPDPVVDYLVGHYGSEAPALYSLCRQRAELMRPVHPEHPAIGAQVVFAAEREFAVRTEDVIARRLRLDTDTADHGAAAVETVNALLR